MNPIIVYRSGTGFTRQYARWLGEALGCEAVGWKDRRTVDQKEFDTIIYGGWFHAGGIRGLGWLKKQLPALKGKRLAVFAVGASPADDPEVEKALAANLSGPQWDGVARFYLRGGLRYEKMGLPDRVLMALFRQMVRKKEGPDSETYRGISRSFDAADRKTIAPILTWAKNE